jgi:uncharacterized RDD family membrane protein YckC
MSEICLPKADLARRSGAFFVDLLVVAFLFALLGFLGPLLAAAYVAFRDGLEIGPFAGRSLGKAALGLSVVQLSGGRCDAGRSVARNWILALPCLIGVVPVIGWIASPILGVLVILAEAAFVAVNPMGRRFGDELAGTQVVAAADAPPQPRST